MTESAAPPHPHQPTSDASAPPAAEPSMAGPPMAQPPQAKPFGVKKALIWLVVIVVVAVGLYAVKGVINRVTGDPDIAKVGDCMAGQTGESLKVVDCGPKAEWKVAGKVDDVKRPATDDVAGVCAKFPTASASFWKGDKGGDGYVLCLEEVE